MNGIFARNLRVWLALVVLLALNVFLAYRPLGAFNLAAALGVACLQALLVAALSMELWREPPLIRLAAAAAPLWILVMFALTFSDLASRPPP